MNKHLHRLVFSRRHGMLLAVAETASASGKAAGGERRQGATAAAATAVAGTLATAALAQTAPPARPPVVFASKLPPLPAARNLPVPYRQPGTAGSTNTITRPFAYDPAKGAATGDLVASGRVKWTVQGSTGTFDQGSVARVVVNWDSFDIGAGHKVHFAQDKDPTRYVSALNRIWGADPSLIFGQLTADREVILLNTNGVYFGRGARVDTGKFVATSLSIADSVFERGLRNVTDASAVFSTAGTDHLATNLNAAISVEAGAEIRSAAGGDVLLVAPRVVNQGRIETPAGQAVLAAGDKVYLMSSSDPAQRGLIVAVDPIRVNGAVDTELGLAENAANGRSMPDNTTGLASKIDEMRAESGTVNLVGLTVRQKGVINATTAVKGANGAIYLQAMASTASLGAGAATTPATAGARGLTIEAGTQVRVAAELGTVDIAAGSTTSVTPEAGVRTQIDAEVFNPSRIRVEGKTIVVGTGATIDAAAGRIELLAAADATANPVFDGVAPLAAAPPDGSRIIVAPGATISAAGLRDVQVDGARNQGAQRLFRIELADAPVQRTGPLYRSQVYFDQRDGSKITAANVAGAAAATGRTAAERSTTGGSVRIDSAGAVALGQDAAVDVSGGSVHYSQTTLLNSLVERNGRVIAFSAADGSTALDSLLATPQRVVSPAYTEGKAGGTLQLNARQLAVADAALAGSVVQGERQRDGTSARAAPALLDVGQAVGTLNTVAAIRLDPARPPAIDPALLASPFDAPLSAIPTTTTLSLATFADSGFGRATLRAGTIDQPSFGTLNLGPGGALDIQAGDSLALNGAFSAAGGSIRLQSIGALTLSGATQLNVAGLWTNDTAGGAAGAATVSAPGAPIQTDGGTVALASTQGLLTVAPGAVVDVSAGAWLAGNGTLKQGKAGTVTVAGARIAPGAGTSTSLAGVALSAFDFAGGGTLAITSQDLTIGTGGGTGFTLDPLFFSQHGFGNIAVNTKGELFANRGDVTVLSGAALAPSLLNWELAPGFRTAPSGDMRASVATARPIDPQIADRRPVNLTLNAGRSLNDYGGSNAVIQRGASVVLEPGGALKISATRSIEVAVSGGTAGQTTALTARGGSIELGINGTRGADSDAAGDRAGFLGDQAIWLGSGAQLTVSGIAQLRPADAPAQFGDGVGGAAGQGQRVTGTVLGGGSITLAAQRGYVVAERGSSLSLDGATGQVLLPGLGTPVALSRAGGSLTVSTPEGFVLEGTVSARAPRDGGGRALADGGSLTLGVGLGGTETVTAGPRPYPDDPIANAVPKPRVVAVGAADDVLSSRGAVFGQDLPAAIDNGIGHVRQALLAGAGFGRMALGAGDAVRFDANTSLNMPLGIELNAPAIAAAAGAQVTLATQTAQLGDAFLGRIGNRVPDRLAKADTSASGAAALTVTAPTIELVGSWGLQGFSNVLLDAGGAPNGEIRLSRAALQSPPSTLAFGGLLELAASQVYATSGTSSTLSGLPATGEADPGSTLAVRTGSGGAATQAPLSAFGALAVTATTIDQGGVLHQPFGSIALTAERRLSLGDGSITSVSGQGSTVPFGVTANLTQWTLPTGSAASTLPTDKAISLRGADVRTSATATVSAAGGGVVQASEFFPGVGGSTDYLQTPGLYAVLPDHAATQPLSPNGEKLPADQQARQIVITTAGSDLAPGTYTLLPAQYALLNGALPQGAYLVSRAADQGSTVLRQAIRNDDGSVVVAGYLKDAGSINVGTPGERFVVEPAATFSAKSETRLTDISQLLAGRAQTLGTGQPLLPRDAGQVQVTALGSDTNTWQARLDLQPRGGRAGLLDMSATQLALVDDLAKTPAGALGVSAAVISDSGAGSVLLGGRRALLPATATTAGAAMPPAWSIDQSATTAVTVDIGTRELTVEELLLAAKDSVTLAAGTRLTAGGTATLGARTLQSAGDGALLAVSANALDLQRTGATSAGGSLRIGAGSTLAGAQVGLDASSTLQVDGTAALQAQALSLGARRIVVGSSSADDVNASVLDGALLAAVRATPDLSLRSYDSIDFLGQQNWAGRSSVGAAPATVAKRLVLDAPLIRGLAAMDGTAASTDIAAQSVALRNTSGRAADPTLDGAGALLLQALPPLQYGSTGGLTLGPGNLTLGFDTAALRSGGDIVLQGSGSTTALRDLTLQSARLTAATDADQTLTAAGQLRVAPEAGSRTLGERAGLGAALRLSGQTVAQEGRLELFGGNLAVQAQGVDGTAAAVTFAPGSHTSVAGVTLPGPDGFDADARAGTLAATAAQGRIDVLGTLDASAARRADGTVGEGDAGRITLAAAGAGGQLLLSQRQADGSTATGSLLARGGSGSADRGGRLAVDVAAMPSADPLADAATAGGFTREFNLRARSGDVALDSSVQSHRILLAADAGSLRIGSATLNAASATGGVVQLAAGGDLALADAARIDARSTRAGANGGDVLLASTTGRIRLAAGAAVDASGDDAQDGRIVLRAERGSDNASVKVDALNTANLKGGEVDIEAVRRSTGITTFSNSTATTGPAGTLTQGMVRSQNNAFMTAKPHVLAALGVDATETGRVNLRAGVEVQSAGNITVTGDWNFGLAADRPGGDAGFLTLRAGGNLLVNGSLSDGFSTALATGLINDNARSWSYRLAAGADLTGANPLAVRDLSAGTAETAGNITVGAGRMLRTGAGSIEMAAGRNINFSAGSTSVAQGLAYVAGRKSAEQPAVLADLFSGQTAKPTFTEQGGRLELNAARDIVSAEGTQLVNNWLWRSGIADDGFYANSSQLAWWTEFSRFRQTLGSFGGGDLTVEAGRDVVNVQGMAPTAAWADSKTLADAGLQVRNGGTVSVTAGRDVLGGQFLVGRGEGRLRAERDIGAVAANVRADDTLLALLDGNWDAAARGSAAIGSAFDPTGVPVSSADNRAVFSSYFYTWGDSAALRLNATAGSASLGNVLDTGSDVQAYGLGISGLNLPQNLFQALPASLLVTAASGNVELLAAGLPGAVLFPSARGTLQVWAGGDLALGSRLAMSDIAPARWPGFSDPVSGQGYATLIGTGNNGLIPGTLANTVGNEGLHIADAEPARLHAGGSIRAVATAGAGTLILPKASEITAGQDILGLQFAGQNLHATDTTRITAGRNLLAGQFGSITLAGPGALDIDVGRQVDLENSAGITTTGNVRNAALPAQGASVRLAAATAGVLNLPAFDAGYLQPGGNPRSQAHRDLLLNSVRAELRQPTLADDEAWAQFQTFPAAAQAAIGRRVLSAEFSAVYLTSAPPTAAEMTASLQTAFDQRKAELLAAGDAALAANASLTLPGREVLEGAALSAYLAGLRGLVFSNLDIDSAVASRVASLSKVHSGWRDTVADSLGGTASSFDALARQDPQAPEVLAYTAALRDTGSRRFQTYQAQVLESEIASAGAAASLYGRLSLPMRLALFDQGFQAAELSGHGSFVAQPFWAGSTPAFAHTGGLEMTQSAVVTERGGAISLVDAGGAINVGLKQDTSGVPGTAKGVIALGGGNVFGYARGDFQVNNQRVFVVGNGDMTIWSSAGDIDSGRGANTAVAAPPLAARRSADGVVFETAATTTGSGLGILEDGAGNRSGTIGLFPAVGEILALDAFIRAPSVLLGSTIRGADNLQAAAVGGAAAPVGAPPVAVSPPPSTESRTVESQIGTPGQEARQRNALLTVDLLGLGPATGPVECSDEDRRDNKCPLPPAGCTSTEKAAAQCR